MDPIANNSSLYVSILHHVILNFKINILLFFILGHLLYLVHAKNKGSSGIWTRDLSHPKRESYP